MTVFGAVKTRAFRIQFSPSAGVGVGSIGWPGTNTYGIPRVVGLWVEYGR